ncbi:hypothetical protein SAMN02745702_02862 [Desulfobaculum bizertense DSM 18034]|uniref:Uncharacterized protein n=1 Tax=Desulfobaculum bizertense DSM 18034 TaxID=1121442 RepID=A0A1T4X2N6_9BACT|nr:hypothetical protein SAMN02745702_02862 [Desulfobaculum bizertense DSM 18034]
MRREVFRFWSIGAFSWQKKKSPSAWQKGCKIGMAEVLFPEAEHVLWLFAPLEGNKAC